MHYTYVMLPLMIAAAVNIAVGIYAWMHRGVPGARIAAVLLFAVGEWAIGSVFEVGSTDLVGKILWSKVEYFGITTVPAAWFLFATVYSGRETVLRGVQVALIAVIPCATVVLAVTNDFHGLIWREVVLGESGGVSYMDPTYGVGFFVYVVYSYAVLLSGAIVIVHRLLHSKQLFRGQGVVLLLAVLAPWVGNLLYVFGLTPLPRLDLTPFGFTVTGLLVVWALFRFRLLGIVPVARDTVIENMDDGVIVVDTEGRIVDLNAAAVELIGCHDSKMIGRTAGEALSESPILLDMLKKHAGTRDVHREIATGDGDAQRFFDVQVSPLRGRRNAVTGHLAVLHDITERRRDERRLRAAHNQLEMRVSERTTELARTNEALKIEIAERRSAEEQLTESLREKEVLLKEIHHRVKNNLQVISSLLYLQSKDVKDERTYRMFQESQNRVKSMALIHEKLYQADDLARIDLGEYLRNLSEHLFESYRVEVGVVKLRVEVEEVGVGVDVAIECGLIVNELISNSLKYGLADGRQGEVYVELRRRGGEEVEMVVGDTGVGMPEGVEIEHAQTLGLRLVKSLTRQLRGRVDYSGEAGVEFTIRFVPAAEETTA